MSRKIRTPDLETFHWPRMQDGRIRATTPGRGRGRGGDRRTAPPLAAAPRAAQDRGSGGGAAASGDASLSIGDLAEATGIPVETLRMWERRYGRPESARLPSGHRRYAPGQVRWLLRVADAISAGARPSEALLASADALDRLRAPSAAAGGGAPGARPDALVAAVREFDGVTLRRRLRALARRSSGVRDFCESVVAPLLSEVGRAWADGRLDVRHEHFLSGIVHHELRTLRAAAKPSRRAPRMVFTTLPGEPHALGMEMAAVVAARAGAECIVVGTDTPVPDIARTADEAGADAVAVSVPLGARGPSTAAALAELRAALGSGVRLLVGGAGARNAGRPAPGVEVLHGLGALEDVVATAREGAR